jgi:hypothetical protein
MTSSIKITRENPKGFQTATSGCDTLANPHLSKSTTSIKTFRVWHGATLTLRVQKKGLMQRLLMGEVRVRV